jgi:hypothetical protein
METSSYPLFTHRHFICVNFELSLTNQYHWAEPFFISLQFISYLTDSPNFMAPKINYPLHTIPPLIPSKVNPLHTPSTKFFHIHFNIILHLHLDLPVCLLPPSDFSTKILRVRTWQFFYARSHRGLGNFFIGHCNLGRINSVSCWQITFDLRTNNWSFPISFKWVTRLAKASNTKWAKTCKLTLKSAF